MGYYFALFQLGKAKDGSRPIDGIVALNRKLLEAKVVAGKISRQKASAIRRILVELGLLILTDDNYRFGVNGVAKKYRLKEAA